MIIRISDFVLQTTALQQSLYSLMKIATSLSFLVGQQVGIFNLEVLYVKPSDIPL